MHRRRGHVAQACDGVEHKQWHARYVCAVRRAREPVGVLRLARGDTAGHVCAERILFRDGRHEHCLGTDVLGLLVLQAEQRILRVLAAALRGRTAHTLSGGQTRAILVV
jgi:hypothetical protein